MDLPISPGSDPRSEATIRLQETLYSSRNPTRQWLHQSRRQWILKAIARYFPTTGEIAVDAGSGSNVLLKNLSEKFKLVVELDTRPALLDHARQTIPAKENISFSAGDIRRFPLRSDRADLVVCSEVLEHVSEAGDCLKEIHRILKPGGFLILTTPQPFSLLEMVARVALLKPVLPLTRAIYREPVLPTGHINLMTNGQLRRRLALTGFKIMETHKSGLYLPGLAEIPIPAAREAAVRLNAGLSGTIFDFLLWTQFFVAAKQDPTRPGE